VRAILPLKKTTTDLTSLQCFRLVVSIFVGAGRTFAVLISPYPSSQCLQEVLTIGRNPEINTCFNLPGLPAILKVQDDHSAIPAVNKWLEGLCAVDPCSDDVIDDFVSNFTSGCASDLSNIDDHVTKPWLDHISDISKSVSTLREIACLKSYVASTHFSRA